MISKRRTEFSDAMMLGNSAPAVNFPAQPANERIGRFFYSRAEGEDFPVTRRRKDAEIFFKKSQTYQSIN